MTYVLGISDRVLTIFSFKIPVVVHIDFGWAFGYDPKDFTGLKSEIRSTRMRYSAWTPKCTKDRTLDLRRVRHLRNMLQRLKLY